METKNLSLAEIEDLALRALYAAGTTKQNARPLAVATAATEADGIASHGLAYIPVYCAHVECGKVDGAARPVLEQTRPGFLCADAATGFAHPAIDMGFARLFPLVKEQGVAGLSINNSYNCGVLGYHTYRMAQAGLIGLGFTNAPASIAPSGGMKPVIGTNPISLAIPGPDGDPAILIDQSASTIAKSEVMKHAREGREIPPDWALDAQGQPTTDPEKALQGSMAPSGGYKGVGIGLIVEILAAALSGASLGIHAAPFSGIAGGPPRTGQFFLGIDPMAAPGNEFAAQIAALIAAIRTQEEARLPGDKRKRHRLRAKSDGVAVAAATLERISKWAV